MLNESQFLSEAEVNRWVQLAQAGREGAAMTLVRAFEPLLARVARTYQSVSKEDARQEATLSFLTCLNQYDPARGVPFAPFAAAKVHGDVRTAMRRLWTYRDRVQWAGPGTDEGDLQAWDDGPMRTRRVFSDYDRVEFLLLLAQTPLSRRETQLVRGFLAGYGTRELAEGAGVSVETVKTWRKRALHKLRAALEEKHRQ